MISDMQRNRMLILAIFTIVVPTVAFMALKSLGVFDPAPLYRPVPPGHQEVAMLAPATSGDSWERLVAAVNALAEESQKAGSDKPKLLINKERAFVGAGLDSVIVAQQAAYQSCLNAGRADCRLAFHMNAAVTPQLLAALAALAADQQLVTRQLPD